MKDCVVTCKLKITLRLLKRKQTCSKIRFLSVQKRHRNYGNTLDRPASESRPVLWKVHIFCLCGWQFVYWKGFSLSAHASACAVTVNPKKTVGLNCNCKGRQSVFVGMMANVFVHMHARVWLFCLQNVANNQHSHTRILCVCLAQSELYEFMESRFQICLWEPGFLALLKANRKGLEDFRNKEPWVSFSRSQVCLLYTMSGNNGRVKYQMYTPNSGTQLQVIKAGSWQRKESGDCNGRF